MIKTLMINEYIYYWTSNSLILNLKKISKKSKNSFEHIWRTTIEKSVVWCPKLRAYHCSSYLNKLEAITEKYKTDFL
jgi:hypothetical protein